MNILLVDDSQTMRRVMGTALENMGYSAESIIQASDGIEAMARLREHNFAVDVILADWNMPNMDGLALLKQLQRVEQLKEIPFIMVTGEAELSRVMEAVRAGARDYIIKPFTVETLRRKILEIEVALLARMKPSDTAIMRLTAVKEVVKPDADPPFISQLPEDLVEEMYERAEMSFFSGGEVLIERGDVARALHIIDMGQVEILDRNNGHVQEVRGRGECFGELSLLTGDPVRRRVCARIDAAIASIKKSAFDALVSECPPLSFHLTRLLAKRARRADEMLVSDLESGISGKLSMMTVAELVQTLHNNRKTGLLRIKNAGETGEIYFDRGRVRHAQLGEEPGEEAFYELVTWTEGEFAFEAGECRAQPEIFRSTMALLIEGMRRQDEPRRMQTQGGA